MGPHRVGLVDGVYLLDIVTGPDATSWIASAGTASLSWATLPPVSGHGHPRSPTASAAFSTVDDVVAFGRMLCDGFILGDGRMSRGRGASASRRQGTARAAVRVADLNDARNRVLARIVPGRAARGGVFGSRPKTKIWRRRP